MLFFSLLQLLLWSPYICSGPSCYSGYIPCSGRQPNTQHARVWRERAQRCCLHCHDKVISRLGVWHSVVRWSTVCMCVRVCCRTILKQSESDDHPGFILLKFLGSFLLMFVGSALIGIVMALCSALVSGLCHMVSSFHFCVCILFFIFCNCSNNVLPKAIRMLWLWLVS